MAANGEAEEGLGDAAGDAVLAQRLWMVPFLQVRNDPRNVFDGLKQVKARRVIIELSLFCTFATTERMLLLEFGGRQENARTPVFSETSPLRLKNATTRSASCSL